MQIHRQYSGIYYVEGAMVPAQIIATGELDAENHRSLRVLTSDLSEADARGFLVEAKRYTNKGDRENVNAIIKVSSDAKLKALFVSCPEERNCKLVDKIKEVQKMMRDFSIYKKDKLLSMN